MKLNYIYFLLTVFVLASCSKSGVDAPDVSFAASKTSVAVGDTVIFTINGSADGFAIYTGDAGHEYEKSKAVWTRDKDITTEIVSLTQAKFDELKNDPRFANMTSEVLAKIQAMIGRRYDGMSHVQELIREYHDYSIQATAPGTLGYSLLDITGYNTATGQFVPGNRGFFTVEAVTGPPGGYATGIGIDSEAISKTYSHKYTTAGTYTVTLVATYVGRKNYSGSGYKNSRVTYESEYNRTVVTTDLTITVN